jgi:SAM-dependent methyltransferase
VDAHAWDERYSATEYLWTESANRFLVDEMAELPFGRALDVACGEGRNAVWLAERGWQVTGVDFSQVGIDKGRRMAADRGVHVDWVCADVTTWSAPESAFDLVVALYLQLPASERAAALRSAVRALAGGGTLLVVAHDLENLTSGTGGPQDPSVLYRPEDVLGDLEKSGVDVEVERAETVSRPVEGAERPALDCLVRVRRSHT